MPNFTETKSIFHNLDPNGSPKKLMDFLKWKLTSANPKWPKKTPLKNKNLPPNKVLDNNKIRVSFVGHVTFLIQTCGFNILTDPVWSKRASPFNFIGPKRVIDPGISLEDLPKIDIILISNNHYDHMDLSTINYLWQRDKAIIITPLENQHVLKKHTRNILVNVSST